MADLTSVGVEPPLGVEPPFVFAHAVKLKNSLPGFFRADERPQGGYGDPPPGRYVICFESQEEAKAHARLCSSDKPHFVQSVSWNEIDRERYVGVLYLPRRWWANRHNWKQKQFRLWTQEEIEAARSAFFEPIAVHGEPLAVPPVTTRETESPSEEIA